MSHFQETEWLWSDTDLKDPEHTILTVKDIKLLLANRGKNIRKLKITKKSELINYLQQHYNVQLTYSFQYLTKKQLIVELKLRNFYRNIQSKKKQYIISKLEATIPKRIKNKTIPIIPWSNTEWKDLLIDRFNCDQIQQLLLNRGIQKKQLKHLNKNKLKLIDYLTQNCNVNLDIPVKCLTCAQIKIELQLLQTNLHIPQYESLYTKDTLVQFLNSAIHKHIPSRHFINLTHNSIPCNHFADPMRLNKNEFFIATQNNGLYLYNIITNKWKQWIKYPWTMQNICRKAICVDEKNKIIYIYYLNGDYRMLKINYESNNSMKYECKLYKSLPWVKFHHLLFVNGQVHLFSFVYGNNRKHWIFDDNTGTFNEFYEFKTHCTKLVHMRLSNKIMLIGDSDDMEIYDGISKQWSVSKLNVRLCIHWGEFHCLTNNERYLIVNKRNANIGVIDLNGMRIMNTDIRCPFGVDYKGIIVKDTIRQELIVCGFVRLWWNKCEMKEYMFPPIYIIKLIQARCCDEYLHVIQSEARYSYFSGINDNKSFKRHFKISVDDILTNAFENHKALCS